MEEEGRSPKKSLEDLPAGLRRPSYDDDHHSNFWSALENQEDDAFSASDTDTASSCSDILTLPFDKKVVIRTENENATLYDTNDDNISSDGLSEVMLDKYLDSNIQEVIQSTAAHRAWDRARHFLKKFSCKDPIAYDRYGKLYDEVREFSRLPEEDVMEFEIGNWEPIPLIGEEEVPIESPEKLFSRFRTYQKALIYFSDHFESMRPMLSDIRQCYDDVFDKCEREWKLLDKDRLEKLQLQQVCAAHVRKVDEEGDKTLMQLKIQAHVFQEHIECQQHTLNTVMGILWKMRQSLKLQGRKVTRTKAAHKVKVDNLAKEIVSQQGQAMYEASLPGKYTEILERFKNINDPREIKRMLRSARKQLTKAHKRILFFEADYVNTVPRAEYDMFENKYKEIHAKNTKTVKECDVLKTQINKVKAKIAQTKSKMYEEVGLDPTTGERPEVPEPVEMEAEEVEGDEEEGEDDDDDYDDDDDSRMISP